MNALFLGAGAIVVGLTAWAQDAYVFAGALGLYGVLVLHRRSSFLRSRPR